MFGVTPLSSFIEKSTNFVTSLDTLTLSAAVTCSYIAFYTGYSKATKSLDVLNIVDLVTLRRGLDWTLVELNKAISLSGMTTMLMSFLPAFKNQSRGLLWSSMTMLWTHSVYSAYKFYGYKLKNLLSDKAIKKASIAFGVAGQLALSAGFWGYISESALIYSASVLSVCHFWTMEVDYKYVLQVRPYAYLPFPLAAAAIATRFFEN
jgi:hypothetical protein